MQVKNKKIVKSCHSGVFIMHDEFEAMNGPTSDLFWIVI